MEHAKDAVKDAACRCKEKMQDKKVLKFNFYFYY